MKNYLSFLLALLLLPVFPAGTLAAGLTDAETPIAAGETLFIKKMGVNYRTAPTPPVYADDKLLTVSGRRLYRLDAKTGDILQSVALAGATMYTVASPTAADGKIFVPLDDGVIQALDSKSLTPLWIYRDPLGGQALTCVLYEDGYLYTGFWNAETEEANYVCLSAADDDPAKQDEEKKAIWTYTAPGGFYGAGACTYGKYLLFGGDDGVRGSDGASRITALNKKTGAFVSALQTQGDLRSETVYCEENDRFYICSKAGFLYRFRCDGKTGKLTDLASYTAQGGMTAAPVIFGGRLYTGCRTQTGGALLVLDADTLEEIYTADMPGYPQAKMTLSTAYYTRTGKVLVYATCNAPPGGIVLFTDKAGQTAGDRTDLFTPPADAQQYCISPISVSPDGTLYYKNDSGCIFAVKSDGVQLDAVTRFLQKLKAFLAACAARWDILFKRRAKQ
ncbi:MAG: PQQ-binding-like beta-propeller repeat protein [Clostridia bacterium]|nr:PQQ-binding-like beta-propeller repeat protein [Clostridia bacterium]